MELSSAYREIEKRLLMIDFPSLYRGFTRFPFALYNETQAYIDGKKELRDINAEFRAGYLSGAQGPERGGCGIG